MYYVNLKKQLHSIKKSFWVEYKFTYIDKY